jgi:molybdate-binding protein/DNA-binding XRE family transcriptional regulator
MVESAMSTSLRSRRVAAGLSQSELAQRVGASRQALHAIESGRQVPSTVLALQLARALRCRVEDLFGLGTQAHLRATLPEVRRETDRRVALGVVDGRWVAHAMRQPGQAADGIVSRSLGTSAEVEPIGDLGALEHNVLVAGCAPLLGVLAGNLGRGDPRARAVWISTHSGHSLELLERGLVHIAGIHLSRTDEPEGHAPLIRRRFAESTMTLVNLTRWKQGLVVAPGNPLAIREIADVLRPDVRFAHREPGAGAQALLERLLAGHTDRPSPGPVASSHAEVANLVRWDVADAGIAIEATARTHGLEFIPLSEERFDLVLPDRRLDVPAIARTLETIDTRAFRIEAAEIPGYDLSGSGHATTVEGGS